MDDSDHTSQDTAEADEAEADEVEADEAEADEAETPPAPVGSVDCNLVGCTDGVSLYLTHASDDKIYAKTATITINNHGPYIIHCDNYDLQTPSSSNIPEPDTGWCGGPSITFSSPTLTDTTGVAPLDIEIQVEMFSGETYQSSLQTNLDDFYPNGESCGQPCRSAHAEIPLF